MTTSACTPHRIAPGFEPTQVEGDGPDPAPGRVHDVSAREIPWRPSILHKDSPSYRREHNRLIRAPARAPQIPIDVAQGHGRAAR